jgi:acyl-CoA synthetase (AMP-forming)/AMP-acid ligase II
VTEVVISGGHNVYPAEVEDVLSRFPDVAEVAVSGTPSDEWGEVVTAWVVSSSGKLDVEGLLSHAAVGLAPYKRPRIVRQVDSLPRNSMGKVMRRSLG